MTDYSEFNYASLMGVIQATQFDDDGAFIPGQLMPSGNPVRALGVGRDMLSNKDMVQQWAAAVKGAYEREISERDKEREQENVPDLRIVGEDIHAEQPVRNEVRHAPPSETLEEELARREEAAAARESYLVAELERATTRLLAARMETTSIRAALAAIEEAKRSGVAGKKKRGRPPIRREVG